MIPSKHHKKAQDNSEMMDRLVSICIIGLMIFIAIMFWFFITISEASADEFVPYSKHDQERLVMAIYKAEGGKGTKYPFGIKSVPCKGYKACKRVCMNTVRNNIARWKKSVDKGDDRDYLTFLWHRYCPPKSHTLNVHWKKNVEWFLKKDK